MANNKRAADIGLAAIQIEGSLIAPAEVFRIAHQAPDEKMAVEYGSLRGTDLREKISGLFNVGRATWRGFDRIDSPTVQQTAAFAKSMLEEVFGFEGLTGPVDHETADHRYRIAWEAKDGRVPVVVAAPDKAVDAFGKAMPEFGDGSIGSRSKRSPAVLLQDWLNATDEALWGLVFAGDRLRLMRDNASFTRPAYIEADLGAIFRDEMYADFTALWLLIHASRFGVEGAASSDCALERWRDAGELAGTKVRDQLRGNVEEVLKILGQGFLDANDKLHAQLDSGDVSMQDWFNQILRTVYRLIFLAVTEDRNLLHPEQTKTDIRDLYASNYGFNHWRERSARRLAYDHHFDNWETINIVFSALESGAKSLGLPALGGLFKADQTPVLNEAKLSNRAFLEAIFRLAWFMDHGVRARINWRDMATEELGSVYESLLELVPYRENGGRTFTFAGGIEAKGNARKTSGSYYTPDSLVQTLLDSTLNPVLDQAEQKGGADEILKLKVIDPACGSGHFLLGAARRMANRVAQVRNIDAPDYQAAMRDVVRNCIHGVDRNPMAIELAKVALWIETVTPGKPLGFLDANIVCGDSLLGIFDLKAIEDGIPDEAFKPLTGDDKAVANELKKRNRAEREGQGSFDWSSGVVASMPPKKMAADVNHLRDLPEETVADVEAKRAKFAAWVVDPKRTATQKACDLQVAAYLLPKVETGEIFARPMVPTTATVRHVLSGKTGDEALVNLGVAASQAASALHWPLAFPEVMIGQGGFDVVIGNPPWEVMQLGEEEYFASRDPEIAALKGVHRKRAIANLAKEHPVLFAEYEIDKRRFESANEFARSCGRFSLTARGKVNTYALFAEHFLNLIHDAGRAGVIVPTGIATDATTAPFFGHLVKSQRLAGLTDFENSAPLFPGVHRSFKFCLMTIGSGVNAADFAFFLTDPAQLEDARRRFTLSPDEIARINPNTKTAPVFRSRYDADLTAAIYNRVPVLIEEGRKDGNPWGVEFRQGLFNMTSDSNLFRTAGQLRAEGFQRDGTDWIAEVREHPSATRRRTIQAGLLARAEAKRLALLRAARGGEGPSPVVAVSEVRPNISVERYMPLYEAKMIHQFDHRWATYEDAGESEASRDVNLAEKRDPRFETNPRYWVSEQAVGDRLRSESWSRSWLMGWRNVCRATDERTVIASAIPISAVGHSMPLVTTSAGPLLRAALLANWLALPFDYFARQKLAGVNLTFSYLNQFPVLPPYAYGASELSFIIPRVLELSYTSRSMVAFAGDLGFHGPPFEWLEARRAQLRAELDAWYGLAYGLNRNEMRYVLDPKELMGTEYPSETFRVLQKNEIAKFGEYRTARLVLGAYDDLIRQGMRPRTEGYRQQ